MKPLFYPTDPEGFREKEVDHQWARTPLVSFCDDDSFWEPDALTKAATYFRKYPHMGVLAGRILIGESQEVDAVCDAMKNSPLTDPQPLPGPPVLGFVCCAVVVRRKAFLSIGGYARYALLKSAPAILFDRDVVPPSIEEQIRKIESFY